MGALPSALNDDDIQLVGSFGGSRSECSASSPPSRPYSSEIDPGAPFMFRNQHASADERGRRDTYLEILYLSRLPTTLMTNPTMTAPNRYDKRAWRKANRLIISVVRSVSETWKVMPRVNAR
jgi:hypothetical protein